MNKYLISADIEGISGVVDTSFSGTFDKRYALATHYMVQDVNAVVRGILSMDPDAIIVVRDAHSSSMNINLAELHPKAQLIQGWGANLNMVESVDRSFKGVFLVGYHAGGQNSRAVLAHTLSSMIRCIKINGELVNEAGVAALFAGIFDVPVAFLSGDDHAAREAKQQLGDIVTVVVKTSIDRACVCSLSLTEAQQLLEAGAYDATRRLLNNQCAPFKTASPVKMEVQFYNRGYRTSLFQRLSDALGFDDYYQFDEKEYLLYYQASTPLEALKRLNVVLNLMYGLKGDGE